MTFWTEISHEPDGRLTPDAVEPLLAELHRALATYPGPLPFLGPCLDDARHALMTAMHHGALAVDDAMAVSDVQSALAPRLALHAEQAVPLHGDAHPGNLIVGPRGPLWIDFEETCAGPAQWDFTCIRQSEEPDWAALDELGRLLRVARLAQAAPWYALVALRSRERGETLDVPGLLGRLRRESALLFGG